MKINAYAALSLVCLTAVGCASKEVIVDNSPMLRTATVTSDFRNSGFKGFFASDSQRTVNTTSEIRRIDDKLKFSGSIMSRVGGKQDNSQIVRIDKNLIWQLDNRKKRYYECALTGCSTFGSYQQDVFSGDGVPEEEDTGPDGDDSCIIETVENSFVVKKTGQTRNINGFPAEEYTVDWRYDFEDPEGKVAQNRLSMTVWTTPEEGVIAEALKIEDDFNQRYQAAKNLTYPAQMHAALPEDAIEVLTQFLLKNISEKDMQQLLSLMQKSDKITGYPVSRKVQWDGKNETCAAPVVASEEGDILDTSSIGGLLRSVGKQVIKQEVDKRLEEKKREIELMPLFSFIEEVKSVEISEVRESQLSVPVKYKLDNRR